MPRPPPPEPPAPRRRVPPQESGDERAEAPNAVPGTPPEAFGPPEEGRPWDRRVRRRSGRSAEPSTPDVVLRSVAGVLHPLIDKEMSALGLAHLPCTSLETTWLGRSEVKLLFSDLLHLCC